MRTQLPFALLATALACTLTSTAAHARARVFVASYGNDSNPCTFGSPCKTFQHAHDVVDAGGEVTAIDSAGFGPISITKAVTFTSPDGVEAGIVPAVGGNAITINAGSSDAIGLRGLTINGAGSALNGVVFNTGGPLTIQNCVVRNLTGQGINFVPITGISSLSVTYTYVGNNGGYGILVQPSGSASATAVFNHVEAQYNGPNAYGIALDGSLTSGTVDGTATDSVSSNNGGGFLVQSNSNVANGNLMVLRSVAANNHTGLQALNLGALPVLRVSETTVTTNVLACNGQVETYQDNTINNNQTGDSCSGIKLTKG
jgi:hypothetical protein